MADTGAIYALIDRSDGWHQRVKQWWAEAVEEVLLPVTVLPEITYFIGGRLGARAEEQFVRAVAEGDFALVSVALGDIARAADLMAIYADAPLGFVDASIVALAERLGIVRILTTDRRHFSLVRPRHVPALRLVP